MRHWMTMACLLLAGGAAWAGPGIPTGDHEATTAAGVASPATAEYQRGDYRFAVGPVPAFVEVHAIPAQWDAAAPGAKDSPWRFWLYDRQADRRRGHDALFTDYIYEVASTSLLEEAGRYQLEFNPGYQQLTLHAVELRRDGHWQSRLDPTRISLARRETDFEQNMADGEVTALIVLDDVRVGDVVRIAYTVTGSNPILAGQFLEGGALGWRHPILDSWLRVVADPSARLATHQTNGAPTPLLASRPDASEATYHLHGVPPVVEEENYPVWYRPYPMAWVSARRGWADVVAWALPLYPTVTALPPDLQARVQAWKALPTPGARLQAALRAVQDEVRYFGAELGENTHRPAPPGETWGHRRGDCKDKAYLLATVLHALGIEAAPALTSMSRGRAVLDLPASAGAFDHVIVRVTLNGRVVWVDPTISDMGGDPAAMDLSPYGAALPVHVGTSALERIQPPVQAPAHVDVTERIAPAADGHFALEVTSDYRGVSADDMRRDFASARTDDIGRRYADYYRKRYGELRMLAAPEIHDDRDANRVTVVERYLLDAPFDASVASARSIDVYPETVARPAALPSTLARTGPLYVARPGEYRHHLQVAVPTGWQPLFVHESNVQQGRTFRYRRTLELDKQGASLDYDFVVTAYDVEAAAASAEASELRKVNDNLSARLRYQVPIGLDAGERDRRLQQLLRNAMDQGAAGK